MGINNFKNSNKTKEERVNLITNGNKKVKCMLNKSFLKDIKKKFSAVANVGLCFIINPTKLFKNMKEYHITNMISPYKWLNTNGVNFKERLKRRNFVISQIKKNNIYLLINEPDELNLDTQK